MLCQSISPIAHSKIHESLRAVIADDILSSSGATYKVFAAYVIDCAYVDSYVKVLFQDTQSKGVHLSTT